MLLRHAKSDWSHESLSDHARPLNSRGQRAAPWIAQWMHDQDCMPDRILCSTAARTRETWERMCQAWGQSMPDPLYLDALYLASPQTILESAIQHATGSHSLLILGHNPGLEMLATRLSDRESVMPTCALAIFYSEPHWPADWWDSAEWKQGGLIVPERD